MKHKLLITLLIITFAIFATVMYAVNDSNNITLKTSNLEDYQEKPKERSRIADLINTYKTTRSNTKDGIRRERSSFPDSNRANCVGNTISQTEMISTNFAGYVLQYPCTVNERGEYSIDYDQNDSIISQKYILYLALEIR